MNVDGAIREFAEERGLPREALQWSLDNWDEASQRLLAKLRAVVNHPDPLDRGDQGLVGATMIIHLFAEKRDARAYAPVCRLIAADEEFASWFMSEEQTLAGVLINLFDGDLEPLKEAIESETGGAAARGVALQALAYLARAQNALSDAEMRDYLRNLPDRTGPKGKSEFWTDWAWAIAELGYEDMRAEVARMFARDWIEDFGMNLEDFHRALGIARRDPDGLAAFREAGVVPFGSTIETFAESFEHFGAESDPDARESDRDTEEYVEEFADSENHVPYVNPMRDVGRNDPCPCGSGKKYKKCCLAV